jgi:aryl-alcohol dehydrogenase-like predicted oxidoreductase
MKYRRLGQYGVQVSEIGFGSWLTFNDGDRRRGVDLHRCAYEHGINFFDTANVYGKTQTELVVGESLKPFRRDSLVIATKVHSPAEPDWPFPGVNDRGLSRKHIIEQCHASLRRLQTEYIDLYQCHRFDPNTTIAETCRAMHDLINQGKVLYWGVSEWNAEQISEAVVICEEHGWHPPASVQPLYNMLERHWEADVFPTCERLGLGIVNFSPLAEGILTGKYLDGTPSDSRASDPNLGQFITPRMTDENKAIVAQLAAIAAGMDIPLSNLALAWCLRRRELSSAIIGASKPSQIVENVKASDITLDDDTIDRISVVLGG